APPALAASDTVSSLLRTITLLPVLMLPPAVRLAAPALVMTLRSPMVTAPWLYATPVASPLLVTPASAPRLRSPTAVRVAAAAEVTLARSPADRRPSAARVA